MPAYDDLVRARFAAWIDAGLEAQHMTEAEAGRAIGRRPGWLARFVARRDARNDLGFVEAIRIVRLLNGDPNLVLRQMAGRTGSTTTPENEP